jgi:hypothetical protein
MPKDGMSSGQDVSGSERISQATTWWSSGVTSRMRHVAFPVGSNVAEGCGRHGDRAMIACLRDDRLAR